MRRGLGIGKGRGYYNIIPIDSYVHSLSAKGRRYYLTQYGLVWKIPREGLVRLAKEGAKRGYVTYSDFGAKKLKTMPKGLYRPYRGSTQVESASNEVRLYHLLDYRKEDFKELLEALTEGREYRDFQGNEYYELDAKKINPLNAFHHEYTFASENEKYIKTVWMKPEDFLRWTYIQSQEGRLRRGKPRKQESFEEYKKDVISPNHVQFLKKDIIKKGKKVAIPFLEFNKWGVPVGHEGRHTAQAMKELGVEEIPVTIEKWKTTRIYDTPPYEWKITKGSFDKYVEAKPLGKEKFKVQATDPVSEWKKLEKKWVGKLKAQEIL